MPDALTAAVRNPPAYTQWTATMKSLGAQLAALPNDPKPLIVDGKPFPRVAAVFRDPAVWGPLVNTRKLPPAEAYSRDGKTAYFLAPTAIQNAARQVFESRADDPSVVAAGRQLEKRIWNQVFSGPRQAIASALGIPPWAVTVAIGAGAVLLVRSLLSRSR